MAGQPPTGTGAAAPLRHLPKPYFLRDVVNPGFEPPEFLVDSEIREQILPPHVVRRLQDRLALLDEKQTAALNELRQKVVEGGFDRKYFDDWALCRYLVARSFDVSKAMVMVEKTTKWREEFNPDAVVCAKCLVKPEAHMMQFVGWDLKYRPVLYLSHRWGLERSDPQENLIHTVEAFNHAIRMMPQGVEDWVVCVDFVTYSHLKDGSPRMAKAVVSVMADHFPERLGCQILVDPPTMFWVLWKIVSSFVDQRTIDKVKFMYTDKEPNIATEFPKIFPPHLASYLVAHFNNNKLKQPAQASDLTTAGASDSSPYGSPGALQRAIDAAEAVDDTS